MRKISSANIVMSTASSSRAFAPVTAASLVVALVMVAAPRLATAGTVTGVYGSREQVRQCAVEQDRLDAQVRQRQRAHEVHVAALGKLEAEGAEITRRQTTVNQDDEASVREFNKLVADHNESADKINQEALESRAIADTYNADAVSHNQRCAGLLIRPEDLAVLTRDRAHAASTPTASRAAASGALQLR